MSQGLQGVVIWVLGFAVLSLSSRLIYVGRDRSRLRHELARIKGADQTALDIRAEAKRQAESGHPRLRIVEAWFGLVTIAAAVRRLSHAGMHPAPAVALVGVAVASTAIFLLPQVQIAPQAMPPAPTSTQPSKHRRPAATDVATPMTADAPETAAEDTPTPDTATPSAPTTTIAAAPTTTHPTSTPPSSTARPTTTATVTATTPTTTAAPTTAAPVSEPVIEGTVDVDGGKPQSPPHDPPPSIVMTSPPTPPRELPRVLPSALLEVPNLRLLVLDLCMR